MAETIRDTLAAGKAARMTRKAAREVTSAREPEHVNPRVWNMFKEAIEFKTTTISPLQRKLADLELSTLDFFDGVLPLLRAPLPRVWQAVDGGLAEPMRATTSHNHPHTAGGDMDDLALRAAVQEFEWRLHVKCRKPLAHWVEALDTVRDKFPELERLRSHLERRIAKIARQEARVERDTRHRLGVRRGARTVRVRHAAGGLRGMLFRCTHPGADVMERSPGLEMSEMEYERTGAGPATAAGHGTEGSETVTTTGVMREAEGPYFEEGPEMAAEEFRREDRDIKLKDRQRKLAAARDTFLSEEAFLYEQLTGLCRDSAWTKSYVAAALLMTKELVQEAVFNLGQTMQPLPAIKTPEALISRPATAGMAAAPAGPEEAEGWAGEGMMQPIEGAGSEVPPLQPGKLGSNMVYNIAMPEFATRARARATLDDLKAAAARRLHAHKATAQPLELHATPPAERRAMGLGPLRPSLSGRSSRLGSHTPTTHTGALLPQAFAAPQPVGATYW